MASRANANVSIPDCKNTIVIGKSGRDSGGEGGGSFICFPLICRVEHQEIPLKLVEEIKCII